MATILLSAAGAAIGGGFGGTVLGLSGAVIGRAVGATLGRSIDQRLLGGSRAVETGRIDRMRIQTTGEGTPVARLWGQMRVPGHVIWASPLKEEKKSRRGGKGGGPRVTEYSYRISMGLALCEGEILGIGRVWADGEEIAPEELNMRVYLGDETQMPDPCVTAYEGDSAPAYRGIAYVVIEELGLQKWNNRVPQLTFEVSRAAEGGRGMSRDVRAVAMIPGTGEYALATTPVRYDLGLGEMAVANVNTPSGETDFVTSLNILGRELPGVQSVSLIVSWFGDDLRAGECRLQPKVEDLSRDGSGMAWRAGGISRSEAQAVARVDDRPIYGGTPADQSVIQALRALCEAGKKPVFYPFILMEQLAGNDRPNPWSEDADQPVMPWRGRITTVKAPGQAGSSDGTAAAEAEVAAFFGTAGVGDFSRAGETISYTGPLEWSYRRFILHYAHLCAIAGSVDAFLIGSEMVALTRIRGANGSYPAVAALRALAADVRAILGPKVKIGYAADWSEYFGHHPGGGDAIFHLDPLWADENIDFIGIDNYMPLSDWRDDETHLDAHWGRIDNPAYLLGNVCGGEGFDWYYAHDEHREAQIRTQIEDGAYGEHWIWRYKDIRGWWENPHHNRVNGIRSAQPTAWQPGSKPIWFTEIGCAALNKGTNQPNKFLDAMSSESQLPYYSNGRRDDVIQAAYLRALREYWVNPANNPVGSYGGSMVDPSRMHVWAWDARPFPAFPGRLDLWSDGPAWERGHWLNGRAGNAPLADVVAEICRDAGISSFDVSGLSGLVRGYGLSGNETGRAALQVLMLSHGFDAVERDGKLKFVMRDARPVMRLTDKDLADADGIGGLEATRAPEPELAGRVLLSHVDAAGDYEVCTAESMLPGDDFVAAAESEIPLALTRAEGQAVAERWLAEARVARDSLRFAIPPSRGELGPGDVIELATSGAGLKRWRIDRVERAGAIAVEATRVEPGIYLPSDATDTSVTARRFAAPIPVWPVFLDLPLLRGDEVPHAPHLAATATPWAGAVAVWSSVEAEGGFSLNRMLPSRAVIGVTATPLRAARAGVLDRGKPLRIRLKGGTLESATEKALLSGANALAIGDGSPEGWEVMQFRQARPVSPGLWEIEGRLRGQAGTDAFMPEVWPAGSIVVLLDGAPKQVELAPSARDQIRHWRIGPGALPPESSSYVALSVAFRGAGLRPLSPCHLRLQGRRVSWIRRTRIAGDGWDGPEVPLGETQEAYLLRLMRDGARLHEVSLGQPNWVIPPDLWQSVHAGGSFSVEVAQLSDVFGPGPFAKRIVDV